MQVVELQTHLELRFSTTSGGGTPNSGDYIGEYDTCRGDDAGYRKSRPQILNPGVYVGLFSVWALGADARTALDRLLSFMLSVDKSRSHLA